MVLMTKIYSKKYLVDDSFNLWLWYPETEHQHIHVYDCK